jgi:hypothetical protein
LFSNFKNIQKQLTAVEKFYKETDSLNLDLNNSTKKIENIN